MTKYKMIVFDIDGTLLPFGVTQLTPRMQEMFEKLKEQGYVNVLCSGRDIFTVGAQIDNPYVDYFVGANGTFILDLRTKEYIFEKLLITKILLNLENMQANINYLFLLLKQMGILQWII